MLRPLLVWTSAVGIAIASASPALAVTATLGASKDATIFENNTSNSNGAGPATFAGNNGMNSPRRGLIDFDIAGSIPAGSTITNVQLTLFLAQVAGTDTTPQTIELHQLTNNWGEGTTGLGSAVGGSGQGFAANPGDATWLARLFPGTLWASPGGDFNATASASTVVGQVLNNPYVWLSTPALVSNVQQWLNTPASNFGWALVNSNETTPTDFRAFFTRDCATAAASVCTSAVVPQLQIMYNPVPEPSSLIFLGVGLAGLLIAARRRVNRA